MSATSEATATTSSQHAVGLRQLSASQKRQVIIGVITGVAGVAFVIAGIAAFLVRQQLATLLFGARFFFSTPVAEIDSWKVFAVALHALAFTGYGILTIVAGCVVSLEVFISNRSES